MKYYEDINNNIYADPIKLDGLTEIESAVREDGTLLPNHKNIGLVETKEDDSYYKYYNQDGTPDIARIQAEEQVKLINSYETALDEFMDSKAKEKKYTDRYTASLRASNPSSIFYNEGLAFSTWMDNCYAIGYDILNAVQSGEKELPTIKEFLDELPILEW